MEEITLLAGQRQKGESYRARIACNDFLRMGPGRSVAELYRQYSKTEQNQAPTRSKGTLTEWSARYGWSERAESYDAQAEAEKNARAREIMASGLALPYERVEKLKRLAAFMEQQLYEQGASGVFHNVWVPDVKQIGSGADAERVDIERFNAAIISEFRAALNDLAAETGGRKNQGRVDLLQLPDPRSLTPEQRRRIVAGEDPFAVLSEGE